MSQAADTNAERLAAQLLAGPPATGPVGVAERLLAIQGQDFRQVKLHVRARTTGVTNADVDRALTEDRSLIITWCNRGTLHLIRPEDYPLLQLLTTPQLDTANWRRLEQEGVSEAAAERGTRVIIQALTDEGPLIRAQLRDRLLAAGVSVERSQALVHVLFLASLRGHIVRGPVVGREQAFVLVRDWLGEQPVPDRDAALGELARRFLAGHGPADERDLARWAGLPLRDARAGFQTVAKAITVREDGLVVLSGGRAGASPSPDPIPPLPPPRLLGGWDPVLLGWCSREPVLGAHADKVTVGGMFKPFALVEGRAAATWRLSGDVLELEPFAALPRDVGAALEADAAAIARFHGRIRDAT